MHENAILERHCSVEATTQSRLAGVFGNSRSGTTWVGAIVSSHPDVTYRFEPFHRAMVEDRRNSTIEDLLRSPGLCNQKLELIYNSLLAAYPEWEKPPFFAKDSAMGLGYGRSILWPLARRNTSVRRLYRKLFTPNNSPLVIFKEVAMELEFQNLVKRTTLPLVYLARHPCSTINSILRGQKSGLMSIGRRRVLGEIMRERAPQLWQRFGQTIEEMLPHQQEALLWRTNVEVCYNAFKKNDRALLVFYENFCREPLENAEKVLGRFGLDMHNQVSRFIHISTSPSWFSRLNFGEVGINRYYTVFRGSNSPNDAWMKQLSDKQRHQILELVSDSPVFQAGVKEAEWKV